MSIETLRCWEESQRRRRREAATGAQPLVVQAMSTDLEQKADIQLPVEAARLAFSGIKRHCDWLSVNWNLDQAGSCARLI